MNHQEMLNPIDYDHWLKLTPKHDGSKVIIVRGQPPTTADVEEAIDTTVGNFAFDNLVQGDSPEISREKAEGLLGILQQFTSFGKEEEAGPDEADSWSIDHQGIGEIHAGFTSDEYLDIPKKLENMFAMQGATFQYIHGSGRMILALGSKSFLLDYETDERTLVLTYIPEAIGDEYRHARNRLIMDKNIFSPSP